MSDLLNLFSDAGPWSRLVGVLGHTLWQGALVSVALGIALRRISVARPEQRYAVSLLALGAIFVAACFTWSLPAIDAALDRRSAAKVSAGSHPAAEMTWAHPAATAEGITPSVDGVEVSAGTPAEGLPRASFSRPAPLQTQWQRLLGYAWLAGVALMLLRLVCSVHGASRVARLCVPVTDPALLRLAAELQLLLGLKRPVRLAVSTNLAGPATVGGWQPLVLFPAAMLTGIPADHLRAILAHELAHIRRHDYLINIGQMLVEALLFFNPAVWWVNRQIRQEREACCDALAGRVVEDSMACAEALALAAEQAVGREPLPLAAVACSTKEGGALADRVRRLVVPGYRPRTALPWYGLATSLLVWSAILVLPCNEG